MMKSIKIKHLRDLDRLPEGEWVRVRGKLNVKFVRRSGEESEKDKALADFFDNPENVRELFDGIVLKESRDEVVIKIPKKLFRLEPRDKLNVVVEGDRVVIEKS